MTDYKVLATIGQVVEIRPISGADLIVSADIVCGRHGRWKAVVGKDTTVGQQLVVFLQDAILPPDPRWMFLEQSKFRIRVRHIKGAPSECLAMNLEEYLQGQYQVGDDLTEVIGVKKYEKPIPVTMMGDIIGSFPDFIPKTDESNFQTIPDVFDILKDNYFYVSIKADGTSCTVYKDDTLHVCSRNWELREFTDQGKTNVYWTVARKYGLDKLPKGYALQFEVVGPGIQGNPMGLDSVEMRAFRLIHFNESGYHGYMKNSDMELINICNDHKWPFVEIVENLSWFNHVNQYPNITHETLLEWADQKYKNGKPAEGIVIRSSLGKFSFKVLNLRYGK